MALGVAGGLFAAGCSRDTTTTSPTSVPGTVSSITAVPTTPTTATTPTTTGSTDVTEPSSEPVATSTTVPNVPTYPLTGLPISDASTAGRPALVVKIDNHPDARPQRGLNEADMVYEENVEQLTRFAAVFQSGSTDTVGPIRSGRTQDVDLLGSLNKPIFAWSGGNAKVSAAIGASDLVAVNETKAGKAMFRDHSRAAPHNLYGTVAALYGFAPAGATPPAQQFLYRPAGAFPAGDAADGVKVSMDNARVHWQWDATSGRYLRFTDDQVHTDAVDGAQVWTNNVVVVEVVYKPSPADEHSPEAQTIGYGVAWVFSGGTAVKGSWSRADRTQPFTLLDAAGDPVLLTPGHTFIELSRSGKTAVIARGADPRSVAYP
ncbi:MAG: hypothetical protein JWM34_5242 [Ilumatobacteraceae bacterium]|nr:hypothetical protein [Ilumatobacteraceae bacterium]